MKVTAWLRDEPAVRRKVDSSAHEDGAELLVEKLLELRHWKKLPDHVLVVTRLGRGAHYLVRVDIVTHPAIKPYVGGLARRCNPRGVEL